MKNKTLIEQVVDNCYNNLINEGFWDTLLGRKPAPVATASPMGGYPETAPPTTLPTDSLKKPMMSKEDRAIKILTAKSNRLKKLAAMSNSSRKSNYVKMQLDINNLKRKQLMKDNPKAVSPVMGNFEQNALKNSISGEYNASLMDPKFIRKA